MKKNTGVDVKVYTLPGAKISAQDVRNFNAQYPALTAKRTTVFHDRFLILDGAEGYHVGASLKLAEKVCGDNIYKALVFFDKMYENMNESERREFFTQLIEKIEIYEEFWVILESRKLYTKLRRRFGC